MTKTYNDDKRTKAVVRENGYDYGILVKLWDLEVDYGILDADDLELKAITQYIDDVVSNHFAGDSGMIAKEVKHSLPELANDLRIFLKELSTYDASYYPNVWKAISEIKDDYSLLRIARPLIGYMWD